MKKRIKVLFVLRDLFKRRADNALAYYNRGYAHFCKGKCDKAIADYTQAIRLDPDDADAKKNLEIALKARGSKGQKSHHRRLTRYIPVAKL